MAALIGPAKGEGGELEIFPEGKRRFVVGLSWTPRALPKLKVDIAAPPAKDNTAGQIAHFLMKPFDLVRIFFLSFFRLLAFSKMAGKEADREGRDVKADQFDLDLDCYIFDRALNHKFTVTAENADHLVDPSRRVYHTGDDQSGMGGGDAEQIFVETSGLPAEYHHLFFVVRSDCKYSFAEFQDPKVRLADCKSGKNALQNAIAPDGGAKAYNYVFCHVFRDGEGWRFRNLDACEGDGVKWEEYLPGLLQKEAA